MRVTKPIKIGPAMWAHICPLCGAVLASASEPEYLPDYSICPCDRNGNKRPVYEIFQGERGPMIRRNKRPRFVGRITGGQISDIEIVELIDRDVDIMEMARAMRKAGEFIKKQ